MGDAPQVGLLDQVQLAADQVDAVYDVVIIPGEEVLPVGRVVGGAQGVDLHIRVDVAAAGGHHVGLILSHGGMKGAELAVDVGDGHGVLIHQR